MKKFNIEYVFITNDNTKTETEVAINLSKMPGVSEIVVSEIKPTRVPMTLQQIEQQLGFLIEIIH